LDTQALVLLLANVVFKVKMLFCLIN
jgi:hypothetical protein